MSQLTTFNLDKLCESITLSMPIDKVSEDLPPQGSLVNDLTVLGTQLRDPQVRSCLKQLSSLIANMCDHIISGDLSQDVLIPVLRCLVNFVADSPSNRQYLMEGYTNGHSLFQKLFTLIESRDTDEKVKLYTCVLILNFILGTDKDRASASYIDKFTFANADGDDKSAWNIILCALKDNGDDVKKQVLDILDELSNLEDNAKKVQSNLIIDHKNLDFLIEDPHDSYQLSILEKITKNKNFSLENDQHLVFELLKLLETTSEHGSCELLFHTVMNLSSNVTNKNDQISQYLKLLKKIEHKPLLRSLILIILSNSIISKDAKAKIVSIKDIQNIVSQYFITDYPEFTSDDSNFKPLELQSIVLMNKLITNKQILKQFKTEYLTAFIKQLKLTCKEFRFQQVFKQILELNLKFIQRLLVGYQKSIDITMDDTVYKEIVNFVTDTSLFDDNVIPDLWRDDDMIFFELTDWAVLSNNHLDELSTIYNDRFASCSPRISESSGPIPFNYLLEATKAVALAVSQDSKLLEQSWFATFFKVLHLVVKQNPSWTILTNNYRYICGIIQKTASPGCNALKQEYNIQ